METINRVADKTATEVSARADNVMTLKPKTFTVSFFDKPTREVVAESMDIYHGMLSFADKERNIVALFSDWSGAWEEQA